MQKSKKHLEREHKNRVLRSFLKTLKSLPGGSIEYNFLIWYIKIRFGDHPKYYSDFGPTEGTKDGGIDAIIEYCGKYYIIQSKFYNKALQGKRTPCPLSYYLEFDRLGNIFADEDRFEDWLKKVRPELKTYYRSFYETVRDKADKIVWKFATLYSPRQIDLENFDVRDCDHLDDNLWYFEVGLEGGTPISDDLILRYDDALETSDDYHGKIDTYILKAHVKDFAEYLKNDTNFFIISQNVRNEIPGSIINEDIKNTYETDGKTFWFSHNGITIVCTKATREARIIKLKAPNVINGGQTLHSIIKAKRHDPAARVLVRILVVPANNENQRELVKKIILRANQQNRIDLWNLRANDEKQVQLQKDFFERKVYYERRIGDWKKIKSRLKEKGITKRLDIVELAQTLAICGGLEDGVVEAKKSKAALFISNDGLHSKKKGVYENLFAPEFDEVFLKYTIKSIVKDTISKKVSKPDKRYVEFPCVAIISYCIEQSDKTKKLRESNAARKKIIDYRDKNTKTFVWVIKNIVSDLLSDLHKKQRRSSYKPSKLLSDKKWNAHLIKHYSRTYDKKINRAILQMLRE